jgi:hypothetical protein
VPEEEVPVDEEEVVPVDEEEPPIDEDEDDMVCDGVQCAAPKARDRIAVPRASGERRSMAAC